MPTLKGEISIQMNHSKHLRSLYNAMDRATDRTQIEGLKHQVTAFEHRAKLTEALLGSKDEHIFELQKELSKEKGIATNALVDNHSLSKRITELEEALERKERSYNNMTILAVIMAILFAIGGSRLWH